MAKHSWLPALLPEKQGNDIDVIENLYLSYQSYFKINGRPPKLHTGHKVVCRHVIIPIRGLRPSETSEMCLVSGKQCLLGSV